MSENDKGLVQRFTLAGDVYQVQRRPMYSQIVINDDYGGIRILDPWSGADLLRVEFTAEYRTSGIISDWCFSSNGASVLVLNDEPRAGCLMALNREGAFRNIPVSSPSTCYGSTLFVGGRLLLAYGWQITRLL